MAVTPGILWEQEEYLHGYEQQCPAFKLPFQLLLRSTSMGPENPRPVGKQAGRKTPHHVRSPNFYIKTENSHKLVPNRDKKAASVHCCGSKGQINATCKYYLRGLNDLAKNMPHHTALVQPVKLCVYVHTLYQYERNHQDKQGLKGHTVKLVQYHASNETDTFPLCNKPVLRPHCLVCLIIYTYKKRVRYQISRGDASYQIRNSQGDCKIKANLIMP